LPLARVEGLAAYPKPPVVQDQAERGDFAGKRVETVTYICERPGRFTLPALVIPWWDVKNQQLMRVTLPSVLLEVEPGPVPRADATIPDEEATSRQGVWWAIGTALLVAVVAAMVWHKRQALVATWERRRARREAGERDHFAELLAACQADHAKEAYNALLRWLDSTHRGPDVATIEDFLHHQQDEDLRQQVEALQESVLGRATSWNGVALAGALRRVHRKRAHVKVGPGRERLPPLNPSWP
jgi:hypothetical protein